MSDMYAIERMVEDIVGAIQNFTMLSIFLGVIFMLVPYFIVGYAIMCTGRKAKVQNDFMAFIPIGRQLYQMKIARCPWWYVFFFGATTITVGGVGIISAMLIAVIKKVAIVSVLVIIYIIANMVFTFFYYSKFYELFGFNRNTAWMNIIPIFSPVATVFAMLIAFSNSIKYMGSGGGKVSPPPVGPSTEFGKGLIQGVSGMYINAVFELRDGQELTFGRSPEFASIVFDSTAADVSKKHCAIRFDGKTNLYVITDYSSTGTYLENGTRIENGQPKQLARGTTIYLGASKRQGFRLS